MSGRAECKVIGRWRIVEADLWDRDYLDLAGPAFIQLGQDGHGELAFGVVDLALALEYSPNIVFFTCEGADEDNEVSGSGSAELTDKGELEIELSFHLGDDATFKARRE